MIGLVAQYVSICSCMAGYTWVQVQLGMIRYGWVKLGMTT
jgi:hypothetical protein